MNSSGGQIRRREKLQLPKRRWHLVGALILFVLASIAIAYLITSPPPVTDENTSGQVDLDPLPQPLLATNLNSKNEALPDLLAGEVPEGVNPTRLTEKETETDALGNPVTAAKSPASPSSSQQTLSETRPGPKTVLIDGHPLDGGSSEIYAELSGKGPFGPLPTKATNGNSSFKAYRKDFGVKSGQKSVALVIGGLGINRNITQRVIETLPANVTLSFAAHAPNLQSWVDKARLNGHEVLLEIPMASGASSSDEPGAEHRLSAGNTQKNKENLDWLLSRAQGYFGVINYNGDVFLTRADAVAPTLSRLSDSGLAFISDGAFPTPSLPALAQSVSLPYKSGFGLIDPKPESALIQSELSRLANESRTGETPIGVGFAYPETISAVKEWISDLPNQSLTLVPASAALKE